MESNELTREHFEFLLLFPQTMGFSVEGDENMEIFWFTSYFLTSANIIFIFYFLYNISISKLMSVFNHVNPNQMSIPATKYSHSNSSTDRN